MLQVYRTAVAIKAVEIIQSRNLSDVPDGLRYFGPAALPRDAYGSGQGHAVPDCFTSRATYDV